MAYYRTCDHCGSHLDPGESCDCRAALERDAIEIIMKLPSDDLDTLLSFWKKEVASRTTADQSRVREAV